MLVKFRRSRKVLSQLSLARKRVILILHSISDLGIAGSLSEDDWIDFSKTARVLRELLNGGRRGGRGAHGTVSGMCPNVENM